MKTLHIMVGLPRSGKSTVARKMGYPIVCPDSIRTVFHESPFKPNIEPMIWAVAHVMVEALFDAGHDDVILDACNHTERRRREWLSPAWSCVFKVVETNVDICIQRAHETNQDYLIPVIKRMAADSEPVGGKTDC